MTRSPAPPSATTRSWCGYVRQVWTGEGHLHLMTGLPKLVRVMGFGFRRPMAASRGRCVAGTVESVGPDVTELKPGDDVYGTCDASFAEFARASAGRIAPKPANLSFEQAAVPVSGLAAMQAVR